MSGIFAAERLNAEENWATWTLIDLVPLVIVLDPAVTVGPTQKATAGAPHEVGAQADDEQADELEGMAGEDKQVENDDVAITRDEESELGPQHDAGKQHDAKLEHDEARELRGRGRTHGKSRLRELVDLRGKRPHLHGREVSEEVAGRLNGHEVTKPHR